MASNLNALKKRLNMLLIASSKGTRKIAEEMGITYEALTGFIKGKKDTQYRTQLRISHYLDKELPKAEERLDEIELREDNPEIEMRMDLLFGEIDRDAMKKAAREIAKERGLSSLCSPCSGCSYCTFTRDESLRIETAGKEAFKRKNNGL